MHIMGGLTGLFNATLHYGTLLKLVDEMIDRVRSWGAHEEVSHGEYSCTSPGRPPCLLLTDRQVSTKEDCVLQGCRFGRAPVESALKIDRSITRPGHCTGGATFVLYHVLEQQPKLAFATCLQCNSLAAISRVVRGKRFSALSCSSDEVKQS